MQEFAVAIYPAHHMEPAFYPVPLDKWVSVMSKVVDVTNHVRQTESVLCLARMDRLGSATPEVVAVIIPVRSIQTARYRVLPEKLVSAMLETVIAINSAILTASVCYPVRYQSQDIVIREHADVINPFNTK